MNDETYEALKNVIANVREYARILNAKKRNKETFRLAVLHRDIVAVESWIDETAKEHND